jgi:hypothetical protein
MFDTLYKGGVLVFRGFDMCRKKMFVHRKWGVGGKPELKEDDMNNFLLGARPKENGLRRFPCCGTGLPDFS